MISNLGYSEMECRNIPVSLGNIAITCPYGTVGKIFDYGINHEESGSPVDSCSNNDQNRGCKPNDEKIDKLLAQAIGKDRFNVKFSSSGNDFWTSNPTSGKDCYDQTNLFFVQYSCIQSNAQQDEKYQHLNVASTTAALISLLFVLLLTKLYKGGKI